MPEYPLLPLPQAAAGDRPRSPRFPGSGRKPSRERQSQRLGPRFERLRDSLATDGKSVSLRHDPSSIAPERALVLEVAGSMADFQAAAKRVTGLEFLGEQDTEFESDEDFFETDTRKGRKGQPRTDKPVGGRLYLAMPDLSGLQRLLSLWDSWVNDQNLQHGLTPWRDVFSSLRDIRPWGPADRIADDTLDIWREQIQADATEIVRVEAELWFRENSARRRAAQGSVQEAVADAGGEIVHRATIEEIGYDAILLDLPRSEVASLVERREIRLAICDEVMFLRPQSSVKLSDPSEETESGPVPPPFEGEGAPPVAALLDGIPVQNHALLAGRLDVDDPDDIETTSVVADRVHGTAMASLILHGDRKLGKPPLSRRLHVRPILRAPGNGIREEPRQDRLFVDLIYRAILRIKEGESGAEPMAPDVFLVNISVCDEMRPFAAVVSPLAKLLDYLADRYGILFLVSAGNIRDDLRVRGFSTSTEFEYAAPDVREKAMLRALADNKAYRTLLAPAEALNVVTVGAQHSDAVDAPRGGRAVDPYESEELPNMSSALGLGHRRIVKPDILMPGGLEYVAVQSSGGGVLSVRPRGRHGLQAAAPPVAGDSLDRENLSSGTSAATASATRACHRIFDALTDKAGGSTHADMDPVFNAVAVKALLVHRAAWGERADLLDKIYEPHGQGKHVERRDNIARLMGYGFPNIDEAIACSPCRATLAGYGTVSPGRANVHAIPLPGSLERVAEPRWITVTLAWFSPIDPRHRAYRRAKLEVDAVRKMDEAAGVKRSRDQPSDKSTPRGTVFHTRWRGSEAVSFVDDGYIRFRVFCREPAGPLDRNIRYGIAVTIEAGQHIAVYDEVKARLVVQAPAGAS